MREREREREETASTAKSEITHPLCMKLLQDSITHNGIE